MKHVRAATLPIFRSRVSSSLALSASLVLIGSLWGCGGEGQSQSNSGTTTLTATVPSTSTAPSAPSSTTGVISGRVYSGATGLPNASVAVGAISTTTDTEGNFTLSGVAPATRAVVSVSVSGHATTYGNAVVLAGKTTSLNIEMLPIGVLAAGNSFSSVATVAVPSSPAQVVVPANALVRVDGSPVTGTYSVQLTPIAPATSVSLLPGEYLATPAVPFETFGALNSLLFDGAGATLTLVGGQNATIRIPVSTRNAALPATAQLYYFDETSGLWVQEGSASLQGVSPNQYYEGVVTHFGIWTAGEAPTTVLVSGCVREADGVTPVADARIATDGIDYSGASYAMSDASGNFQLPIKLNADVTLVGSVGSRLTNTLTAGPFATNSSLPSCLLLSAESSASIKLTWGPQPNDVDSHLFTPDGSHVYFGSKGSLSAAPFASLDVDDLVSYGPEVITFSKLRVGTYTYAVHNYSGTFAPGMTSSPVRVEFSHDGTVSTFTPGAGEGGVNDWWTAFTFTVSSNCAISVQTVNTWGVASPTPPGSGSPIYCSVGALSSSGTGTVIENLIR